MRLHFRLWIVFSIIWLIGAGILYGLIVNIYNDRMWESQKQVALSQGYTITGRISGLYPMFFDRAEGYLDYYSEQFETRLILLSDEKQLIYDSFAQLSSDDAVTLSILEEDHSLPTSMFTRTKTFGLVQYTLLPIDERQTSGYLLMVADANALDGDMNKFREQVLMILGLVTVISFLIFYVIASWFTHPIRRIMWHLKRITPQERTFAMRYRRRDEIGNLVNEIKAMVQQVNEYEQRQRRFISASSHELKTPLATMQLILENLPLLRSDEVLHQEYIVDLQRQVDKMKQTVQGMLDVYRLAEHDLVRVRLPFSRIQREIDDHFQHIAEHKQIQFVYENDCSDLTVDAELFIQGVFNIVANAINYSPEQTQVVISLKKEGTDHVQFSVRDHGIGIAEQDLPHVFEPFFRSNEAMGWSQDGSGLGLAIVKQMVELHGGEVMLNSHLGQGTCVTLKFKRNKSVTNEA